MHRVCPDTWTPLVGAPDPHDTTALLDVADVTLVIEEQTIVHSINLLITRKRLVLRRESEVQREAWAVPLACVVLFALRPADLIIPSPSLYIQIDSDAALVEDHSPPGSTSDVRESDESLEQLSECSELRIVNPSLVPLKRIWDVLSEAVAALEDCGPPEESGTPPWCE